ncbi:rRNA methyltransferase 1, mitochondrial [Galendromus occidentalis]|uniref:rRNA methyltransferase 1, mitochondrial n=1 Tax=Galendromus occidentalis TaxID=34638 RepID=A0AAJ6QRW8_9ACAR|nr:rRNA methyltransferase 1, mitochondrial [Galendromus occidentalis]
MLKQLSGISRQVGAFSRLDPALVPSRSVASQATESVEESVREETEKKPKKALSRRRAEYESPRRDLLFGIHPVELALAEKRRKFYKLFLKPNRGLYRNDKLESIHEWAENLRIPIRFKCVQELSSLTRDAVHQGVVLQASRLKHKEWSDQMEIFGKSDDSGRLLVYMDRIMDPMNMGAVIRTCVFLGVDAILVPKMESCALSTTVSKASSGALECATICTVESPLEFMTFVKKLNWDIVGSDSDCQPYNEFEVTPRNRLLILGNEGHGVNQDLVEFFTETVSVPGVTNRVGSLNVSVTSGILLSHFTKLKQKK